MFCRTGSLSRDNSNDNGGGQKQQHRALREWTCRSKVDRMHCKLVILFYLLNATNLRIFIRSRHFVVVKFDCEQTLFPIEFCKITAQVRITFVRHLLLKIDEK